MRSLDKGSIGRYPALDLCGVQGSSGGVRAYERTRGSRGLHLSMSQRSAGAGEGPEGGDYQCRRCVERVAHPGHRGEIGIYLRKVTELQLFGAQTTFDE